MTCNDAEPFIDAEIIGSPLSTPPASPKEYRKRAASSERPSAVDDGVDSQAPVRVRRNKGKGRAT